MIVNKKISELLEEISNRSIEHANTKDEQRRYIKKLINIFINVLTYDEQVYLVKYFLDNIHYKNILIDPETMLAVNNMRLRTIFLVFLLTTGTVVLGVAVFGKLSFLPGILDVFGHLLGFLSL